MLQAGCRLHWVSALKFEADLVVRGTRTRAQLRHEIAAATGWIVRRRRRGHGSQGTGRFPPTTHTSQLGKVPGRPIRGLSRVHCSELAQIAMSPTRAHSPDPSGVRSLGTLASPAKTVDSVEAIDARLAEAIEHIAGSFIILDRTWRFSYVNRNAVRPIDLVPEDVIGRDLWEMFPEFRGSVTAEHYQRVMNERQTARFEDRSPVNGRWYEISVYPVPEGIAAHWHDITDRKLAEVALAESEERARLTADAGQTGLFDWEPAASRMYWSDQNFRTLGLSPGDVEPSYSAWATRVHPDDLPRVEALVAEAQSQRRPYYGVHRVVWPDGSIHVMEARAQFSFDESGACTRMRGTYVDVTERALAEQALRESEARFRAMANDAPLPIWMTDAVGAVQFINATYREFFGVSDANAGGIDWPSLIHPDDRAAYVAAFGESIRTREPFEAEARARRSDGTWRWISSRGVPRWTADGAFLGLVGTSPDVSERRRLEEHERAASVQAHFRSLFESVPGPCVVLTPDEFRIVAVSDAYLVATHTTRDALIGRSLFDVYAPEADGASAEALTHLRASLSRVVEQGRVDVIPVHRLSIRRPQSLGGGADERWWSPVSAPVIGPDGRVAFVIHRTEDVTDYMTARSERTSDVRNDHRHAAEVVMRTHELHRVNEQLRAEVKERRGLEAQRGLLMRQLVIAQEAERSRVARELHDGLGQHLTALNFSLESLMADVSGSPALRSGLERMQRLARTLDSEVDRIAADLRPTVLDDLGLEDALHRHVRLWSDEVGVAADIHTRGLESRLGQVIETTVYRVVQEALTNVHKHAHATRISVVVERRDGELVVAIEDNGVGFAGPAAGGTSVIGGLGLSTMRERAALVGGDLQVESEIGVGTTVYLRIAISG